MAQQTITSDTLMESLFEVFRCHGYEGTTLSQLSEVTGLQKSSLYHHFPEGKVDIVKAVLTYFSAQLHQNVIEPLLDNQKSPEKRFSNMLVTIKAFYKNGKKNCLLNALSLGEAKDEIKVLMSNDYNAWLAALNKLGKEAGMSRSDAEVWSERFLIIVEGALVVQRLTRNALTFDNTMDYEKRQFLKLCGG
jgi:AcrR family transcriptional regulator